MFEDPSFFCAIEENRIVCANNIDIAPALVIQIARAGNSTSAREYMHRLDVDPVIGRYVDCIRGE